ncbi:MHC class I-like protein MILL2 [Diceros bicornis minor]|uniref:MHC class I-like protein MILL2 n=1 Tax=Diceros bicornis minor TaxID=77932 RepID=UPI0026F25E89|nr:MHC class I-like protein MILL2 [Diceros bicornis minor]
MGIGSPGVPRPLSHLLLLLLLLEESRGFPPGAHTLRYDLMALSLDGPEKPQFLALGYFDDELFLRYDGESQRAEPRGLGIRMDLGAETWEREATNLKEKERQLRQLLAEIMGQQGQGSDPPSVTVTRSKNLLGKVILKCWAFSFYPRDATLTWLRDGDPMHHGTFGPGTNLPSGDGTYQTWVDTRILPGEEQRFTCHVGHCGLNTTVPAVSGEELGEPLDSRELEAELV